MDERIEWGPRKRYAYEAAKQTGLCGDNAEDAARFQLFWQVYLDMSSDFEAAQQIYTLSLLDDEREKRADDCAYYRKNNRYNAILLTLCFLIGAAGGIIARLL